MAVNVLRCGFQVGLPLFRHQVRCGWRQNKPLKCRYTGASLHGVTLHMRIIVIITDAST